MTIKLVPFYNVKLHGDPFRACKRTRVCVFVETIHLPTREPLFSINRQIECENGNCLLFALFLHYENGILDAIMAVRWSGIARRREYDGNSMEKHIMMTWIFQ